MKIKYTIFLILLFSGYRVFSINPQPQVPNGINCILPTDIHTVTYWIPLVSGADSYIWTAPSQSYNTKIQNLAGDSVTIEWKQTYQGVVQLTVTAHFPTGNPTNTSNQKSVSLNIQLGNPGNITADNSVCQDEQAVYSVLILNATSYIWTPLPSPNMSINGSTNTNTVNIYFSQTIIPGDYTITVTGTNGGCESQSQTITVTVNPLPVASFSVLNAGSNHCANEPVNFANTSSTTEGTLTSCTWNFGDIYSGTDNIVVSCDTVVSHIFSAVGNLTHSYSVQLTVINSFGCSKSNAQSGIIVKDKPSTRLIDPSTFYADSAHYWTLCQYVTPSHLFTIKNFSSTDLTNTHYTINWQDSTPNFDTSGTWVKNSTVTHLYTGEGNHCFTITVTGANGCTNSRTYCAFIGTNPAVAFGCPQNTTNFVTGDTYEITLSLTDIHLNSPGTEYSYTFSDDPDNPILFSQTYITNMWESGQTQIIISHQFNESSINQTNHQFFYTARSINQCSPYPTTAVGCTFIVSSRPTADFGFGSGSSSSGGGGGPWNPPGADSTITDCNTVDFHNSTIPGFYVYGTQLNQWDSTSTYLWNFGDTISGSSNTSTLASPTHYYSNPGWYQVLLIATTSGNPLLVDSVYKWVYVQTPPVSQFTIDTINGCAPGYVVTVNNNTTVPEYGITTSSWSVSPAEGCTISNPDSVQPTFIIDVPGTYIITLTSENSCCTNIYTDSVYIPGFPGIIFPQTQFYNCGTLCTTFTPSYTENGSPISYHWDIPAGAYFAPPSTDSIPDPEICFPAVISDPVTYTVTITATNDCGSTINTIDVTINPVPVISLGAGSLSVTDTVCSGEAFAYYFSLSVTGAPPPSWSAANIINTTGLESTGTGNIITSIQNNTSSPITIIITVNPLANGCSGPPFIITLTVNPAPGFALQNMEVCSGESFSFNPASLIQPTGASYIWNVNYSPCTSVYSATDTLQISNCIVYNNTPSQKTLNFIFTLTSLGGGCPGTSQLSVIVDPLPVATLSPPSQSLCSGNSTSISVYLNISNYAGFIWNRNALGDINSGLPGSGSASPVNETLFSISSNPVLVLYQITPNFQSPTTSSKVCYGDNITASVTVNPTPIVVFTCVSNPVIYGSIHLLNACASYGGVGTLNYIWSSGVDNNLICSPNTLPVTSNTTYTVTVTDTNYCMETASCTLSPGSPPGCTVEVNPGIICEGDSSYLSVTVTGGGSNPSFLWSPGTFGNVPAITVAPGIATNYSVTVNDGYTQTSCSGSVNVNYHPEINSGSNITICSGTVLNYNITSDIPGTTFTWTAPGYGTGQISMIADPPGMNGSNINDVLTNITNSPVNVSYIITPTGPSPTYCQGNPFVLTVTVNPDPDFSFNPSGLQTIISGTTLSQVNFISPVAGVNYDWSCPSSPDYIVDQYSGTSSFLPAINITNNTLNSVPVTFTINSYFNGCSGATHTYTVTINVLPAVFCLTASGNGQFCEGGQGVEIGLNGSEIGINYYLYRDNILVPFFPVITGTNLPIYFGYVNIPGTYMIKAVNNLNTALFEWMDCETVVYVDSLPLFFSVYPPSDCVGSEIMINGSQTNVQYELLIEGNSFPTPVIVDGTGLPWQYLSFGNYYTPGEYSVIAIDTITNCSAMMPGTTVLNPLPVIFDLVPYGVQCIGTDLQLSGSEFGVTYHLIRTFAGISAIIDTITGTGLPESFGPQYLEGTYTAEASNQFNCSSDMNNQVFLNLLPDPYNVISSDNCAPVQIGLNNSTPGIIYELYRDGSFLESTFIGTGGAFTFDDYFLSGSYSVIAKDTITMCESEMLNEIIVLPAPFIYDIQPNGPQCIQTGDSVEITLPFSEPDVNYQLYRNNAVFGSTVTGNSSGGSISFGIQGQSGLYTIRALNTASGCTSWMNGNVNIIHNPDIFSITSTGICSGSGIGLSGSQYGYIYHLLLDGEQPEVMSFTGTGNSFSFGAQLTEGVYTIIALNPGFPFCQTSMLGSVTIHPKPDVFNLYPQGILCEYDSTANIFLDGSEDSINYQLIFNSSTIITTITGTGDQINFGNPGFEGSYSIIAFNPVTGCYSNMNYSAILTPGPLTYSIMNNGNACAGSSVKLSWSQTGINYELWRDSTILEQMLPGVNGILDFGPQNMAGEYTILAHDTTSNCQSEMYGSIVIFPNPVSYNLYEQGINCGDADIYLSDSQNGVNYQLYCCGNSNPLGLPLSGNVFPLEFGNFTTPGNSASGTYYWVMATSNTSPYCQSAMNNNVDIYSNPVQYDIQPQGVVCVGTEITLSNSESGVKYELYRYGSLYPSAGNPLVVNGTGGQISFGISLPFGTYTIQAVNNSTTCSSMMIGSVIINTQPAAFNLTAPPFYCANTNGVTITLDHSELNVSYQLFRNDTAEGTPLYGSSSGDALFWTEITEGNYYVIAYVVIPPDSSCSTFMNGILTIVQEPVQYVSSALVNNNITCHSGCNGKIDLVIDGGNSACYPGYQFNWSNGFTIQNISELCAGNYTVSVIDCNGCIISESYLVSDIPPISVPSVIGNCSCPDGNDGSIIIAVAGGTWPYSFLWSNGKTTQNIFDLQPGTYYVSITDNNNCSFYGGFNVGEPNYVDVTGVITNPGCYLPGNDGAIDISVTGGTSPYNYVWSTGSTSEDIQNLIIGTYCVVVIDNNGCVYDSAYCATLTSPLDLLVEHTEDIPSCCGAGDGKIALTVSGGIPPYNFAWSGPEFGGGIGGNVFYMTNLLSGLYVITITDVAGCPYPPIIQTIFLDQPLCLAVNYGTTISNCTYDIDLNVTGGTSNYSYHWSNNLTTGDVSGLDPGFYCVTIIDQNYCDTVICIALEMIPPVQFNGAQHNCTCNLSDFGPVADGFITLNITSGLLPFLYVCEKDNNPYLTDFTLSNTIDITGLAPGMYCITVTDINGCTSTLSYPANCFVVTEPEAMDISGLVIDTHCNQADSGYMGGAIILNVTGENPPYEFLWNPTNCISSCNPIPDIPPGDYNVTVTDVMGCYQTAVYTVNSPPPFNILSSKTDCICNSNDQPASLTNNGSITLTVTGETPIYIYLWNNGSASANLNSVGAGNYVVTVTDSQGCINTAGLTINEPPPLTLGCIVTPEQPCYNANDGSLCMDASGETFPYTYLWSVSGSTDACLYGLSNGSYGVTVTDVNSCWNFKSCMVVEPPPLQVNAVIQDNFCNSADGPPSGSITLTVVGGVSPYAMTCVDQDNVSWPFPFTNLPPGYYCITINDCDTTLCYPVNEPLPLSIALEGFSDENCYHQCSGDINISVNGGTLPYSYNWMCGGSCWCPFIQINEDLIGIGAGTYSVNVHDVNYCPQPGYGSINLSQVISGPPDLIVTSSHTDCSYLGCCDGSIDLNISGGITPYNINWTCLEDSSFFNFTSDLSCLCAGTYQYEVGFTGLQGYSCIKSEVILIEAIGDSITLNCGLAYCSSDLESNIITLNFPPSFVGDTVNILVEGFDVTIPGGPIGGLPTVYNFVVPDPPVYTFSPGTPPWTPFVLNTLQYNVSVTFAGADPVCPDCILTNYCELVVYPAPAVTINETEVKVCCDSLPVFEGIPATVIGAPGTQYVINYTVASAIDTMTFPYTGTISPPNSSEMIFLPIPPMVNCNSTICPVDTYSININSISILFDTIVTCPGSSLIDTCKLIVIPNPTATLNGITIIPTPPVPGMACVNDSIKLEITFQGVPPFFLLYNDGLNPDPHYECFDITGTGCNQLTQIGTTCVYTGTVNFIPPYITYPHNFAFSLESVWDSNMPDVNCGGHAFGYQPLFVYSAPDAQFTQDSITICSSPSSVCIPVILDGTPPFFITPLIEYPPGTYNTLPVVGPVYQNNYDLCITNIVPAGTSACLELIISLLSDNTPPSCDAENTDSITVCLTDVPLLNAGNIITQAICEDQNTTEICLNLPGNGPWVVYYTQDGTEYSVTLTCNVLPCCFIINPLLGQIVITGLMIQGCEEVMSLNIPVIFSVISTNTASLSLAAGQDNSICEGESVVLVLNLTGVSPWNVTVQDGLGNIPVSLTGINVSPYYITVTPVSTTEYSIASVSDNNATDCPFIIINSALVIVNPSPFSFFCSFDVSVCPCEIPKLCISFTGSPPFDLVLTDGITQITERFTDNINNFELNEIPPACLAPFPLTTLYQMISVTDATGCSNNLNNTINVTVDDGLAECPCYLELPTSFSPNGDNINDLLKAEYSSNIIYFDFRIFNLWGDCVFQTNDTGFLWDGKKEGTSEILDIQVFYYYIDAICSSNERIYKKGNITLIK